MALYGSKGEGFELDGTGRRSGGLRGALGSLRRRELYDICLYGRVSGLAGEVRGHVELYEDALSLQRYSIRLSMARQR